MLNYVNRVNITLFTSLSYSSLKDAKIVQKASGILNWFEFPCKFLSSLLLSRLAIAKLTRASRRCAASRTASICPFHAIDIVFETRP